MIELSEFMFFENLSQSNNIGNICFLKYAIKIFGYIMMA
jgi:hypothetical protein